MTTIAYRDGVLAADSLATWGDARDGYCRKIERRGRVLAASAGNLSRAQGFLDWFRSGMQGDPPPAGDDDAKSFNYLIDPDGWFLMWGPKGWERTRGDLLTLGSGGEYARGALAMGATPEEAVAVAIQYDTKSGGPITVLSVR